MVLFFMFFGLNQKYHEALNKSKTEAALLTYVQMH